MSKRDPIAFLSYVRSDDDHDNGNITNLRHRLEGEIRAQIGRPFPIFQDRNDIQWGQNWKERLGESLTSVTFLLPIITPSFFNSPACRSEFTEFQLREQQIGFNHLILPIYYIDCDQLGDSTPETNDEIARTIMSRQWTDWRELRFAPLTAPEPASALAKMAKQVKGAMKQLEIEIEADRVSKHLSTQSLQKRITALREHRIKKGRLETLEAQLIPPSEPYTLELSVVRDEKQPTSTAMEQFWSKPYYIYSNKNDEVTEAQKLSTPDELSRLSGTPKQILIRQHAFEKMGYEFSSGANRHHSSAG